MTFYRIIFYYKIIYRAIEKFLIPPDEKEQFMNRKEYIKVLLGFTALMNLSEINADDETYGYLTGINNHSRYTVKVQTSEDNKLSSIEKKDGSRPSVQNVEFDVKDIQFMKLVVPWDGWYGDATIHVRVYNQDGTIRSQADITDRNGNIWVHDRKKDTDIKHIEMYQCYDTKLDIAPINRKWCDNKTAHHVWIPKPDQLFTLTVNADGQITE